jgi:Ni,Fe-hydrogenase III large subunit
VKSSAVLYNGQSLPIRSIPLLSELHFSQQIIDNCAAGMRLSALFADELHQGHRLYAVLTDDASNLLHILASKVEDKFTSLTPDCLQAHLFEREIFEQSGIEPAGHPWLKPVRFSDPTLGPEIGVMDFFHMSGEEVHEVAVGPVHAGVIEPGHFRFQCHGEKVHHLEISLGYQHRGLEKQLIGGPTNKTIWQMEAAAGDTSIGHAMAHCLVHEALAGCRVSGRSQAIRGIALELERIANHIGDLGALAGDVGFLPTASQCGAIRGDFLNMTALLCGSRMGRALLLPGGVRCDVTGEIAAELQTRLHSGLAAATRAIELLWDSSTVVSRFENTGTLKSEQAIAMGLVGPARRACGLEGDIRHNHPCGIYQLFQIPVSTANNGDVYSRAMVRWLEVQRSVHFIQELLASLPEGELKNPPAALQADAFSAGLVEGWRGEICHIAITDKHGGYKRYKIIDPSFHNWFGLALCLREQAISDFPLCNKSFNLSYCGFDL